jgi:hypothetical protein
LGVEFETEAEARSQINSSGGYIKTVEINNAK